MGGPVNEAQLPELVIYQDRSVRISVKSVADPAAVTLLQRTVYGISGIQYQHTGQEQKIHQIQHPFFFHLFQDDTLIGIYCLSERSVGVSVSQTMCGYYGRYLSIAATHQGKGFGSLLKQQAVQYIERQSPRPIVFYSYIEEKNTRSMQISQKDGFISVALLKTFVFRRYSPKVDHRFSRLSDPEKPILLEKLARYYSGHTLVTFARIGYQSNYFVLKEHGEIVAGVQANPVCWNFLNMPGASGWVMMHILPLLSATRRFFDPDQYQFVALEGIYLKEGYEDFLSTLLESVLAHFNYHSALWQIDRQSPLIRLLDDQNKMGRLSHFQQHINTHVLVKPKPLTQPFPTGGQPVYVSSFDFT